MPVVKTQTATTNAEGTEATPRKKAPTIRERFENFIVEFIDIVDQLEDLSPSKERIFEVIQNAMNQSKFVPKAKGVTVGRGAFYQIFGTDPQVGTTISPSDVVDKTDGKVMLTEAVLKRWADPAKGVPYGKGATAIVTFYRRAKHTDGTIREAYYKLEAYNPKPTTADENGFDVGEGVED